MKEWMNSPVSPRTQSLYGLIRANGGKRILLAQQESPRRDFSDAEMDYLLRTTGRLPAVRGLDFIHNDFRGVVERAVRWNDRGGIVTICWHTGVSGIGYPDSKDEFPDFDALLTAGTPENALLRRRWEDAALALRRLQDMDIPVLWRPFHEFDGQWFWWGKGGGARFIALWRMMHDCFTREYGLNNLLWVLGYADDVRHGWYPGDDCCDILGSDTYRGVTTHASSFRRLRAINEEKPLAFHECGKLPAPDDFFRDRAVWSWVMPWHSRWLMQDNTPERICQIYRDERMITLDELKGF